MVRVIKKQLVKRSLDMIKDIAARPEKDGKNDYDTFWESFGKFIKLGAIEDQSSTCALSLSEACLGSRPFASTAQIVQINRALLLQQEGNCALTALHIVQEWGGNDKPHGIH